MGREEMIQRIALLPMGLAASAGDSVFSSDQLTLIGEAYMAVFGKEIRKCSCGHRYADALIELCSTLKIKSKMEYKYRLFAGVLIWIGNDCYSNSNLTDEIAEKYLAMHPEAREKEFQLWPEEPQSKEQDENVVEPEPETAVEPGHDTTAEEVPEDPQTERTPKSKKGR